MQFAFISVFPAIYKLMYLPSPRNICLRGAAAEFSRRRNRLQRMLFRAAYRSSFLDSFSGYLGGHDWFSSLSTVLAGGFPRDGESDRPEEASAVVRFTDPKSDVTDN
jgi:hypothetical protein